MTSTTLSSLVGGALGDALGYSREFSKLDEILEAVHGNWRSASFRNYPRAEGMFKGAASYYSDGLGNALISDDTQMTIATGRALLAAESLEDAQDVADALIEAYVTWSKHPDNHRAPGGACMAATKKLAEGADWQDATGIDSMGCGANMRVAPIALHSQLGPRTARDLAQLSAVITHGHPGAVVATALTVDAIRAAAQGYKGVDILDMLIQQCQPGLTSYYPHWVLSDLWEQGDYESPEAFMQAGYAVCLRFLAPAQDAIRRGWAGHTDPCVITGQAWTAPQALAGAVLCVAGLWEDPLNVIRRGACSNGDSDSLAAIAGNIRGAAPETEWPEDLVSQLEPGPLAELHKIAETL